MNEVMKVCRNASNKSRTDDELVREIQQWSPELATDIGIWKQANGYGKESMVCKDIKV